MENNIITKTNDMFGELKIVMIDNEPWFVGREVAEKLGYSNPQKAVREHVDDEDKIKEMIESNGGIQMTTLINKRGVCSLISKSKTKSKEYKDSFKNWLVSEGLIEDNFYITSRKEIEFLDMLEEVLKPFGYKTIRQYSVLDYRVDLYIEDLNIAVEYDEDNHNNYSYEQHEWRQVLIEKELGCKFIRLSDKEDDLYNIGLVMKDIMFQNNNTPQRDCSKW